MSRLQFTHARAVHTGQSTRGKLMRRVKLAIAIAAAAASLGVATPAAHAAAPHGQAVINDDGWGRHRFHHFGRFGGFGFPIASPFLFGGGFGFGGGGFGFGGGCDIFLATGDINSYVLCRVG